MLLRRSLTYHRSLSLFSGGVSKKLEHYSQFQPQPLTIQQYLDFGRQGTAQSSFRFLQKELLVRLANIMQEIDLLPSKLLDMPSAKLVANWYRQSFEDLLLFEHADPTIDKVNLFNDQLQTILKRHGHVVETMASALIELKETDGVDLASERGIQYFLDRFYLNRISIRMLQNQHLVVFGSVMPECPRHVGCIDPQCDVNSVVIDAFENARFLCDRYYLASPSLEIECYNAVKKDDKVNITAIPSHLYHIMFELFKNAMRATVEFVGVDDDLPPIVVKVIQGSEDLSIKISDQGGGVPRTVLENLFNYMYSTAPAPPRDGSQAPLAGFGYGLPLSRLYARYFLGDLFLVSMEGYGTDAFIFLKALPFDATEVLPIYSSSSRRTLTKGTQAAFILRAIFICFALLDGALTQAADWSHLLRQKSS